MIGISRVPHLNSDQATPHEEFGLPPQEVIDARTDALVLRAMPWLAEPPQPTSRRSRRSQRLAIRGTRKKVYLSMSAALVVAAAVAGTAGAAANRLPEAEQAWATKTAATRTAPTPGTGAAAGRVLPAVPLGDSDAFAFRHEAVPGQEVVGFDPCRSISYVIQTQGAPAGAREMIQRATERISAASGLAFEYAGETDEALAAGERSAYQPDRYGDRWAPVLISWESALLPAGAAGDTETVAMQSGDSPFAYVSGQVVLDGALLASWAAEQDGERFVDAVVAGQLARLLGLAEVDMPGQLLSADFDGQQLDFGDGDRAGLALAGSGECVPAL